RRTDPGARTPRPHRLFTASSNLVVPAAADRRFGRSEHDHVRAGHDQTAWRAEAARSQRPGWRRWPPPDSALELLAQFHPALLEPLFLRGHGFGLPVQVGQLLGVQRLPRGGGHGAVQLRLALVELEHLALDLVHLLLQRALLTGTQAGTGAAGGATGTTGAVGGGRIGGLGGGHAHTARGRGTRDLARVARRPGRPPTLEVLVDPARQIGEPPVAEQRPHGVADALDQVAV